MTAEEFRQWVEEQGRDAMQSSQSMEADNLDSRAAVPEDSFHMLDLALDDLADDLNRSKKKKGDKATIAGLLHSSLQHDIELSAEDTCKDDDVEDHANRSQQVKVDALPSQQDGSDARHRHVGNVHLPPAEAKITSSNLMSSAAAARNLSE